MLAQELDDRVDTVVLSAADHSAPHLFLRDQPSDNEPAQVKGECRGRHVQTGLNVGDAEAGRTSSNKKPINI